MVYNTSYNLAHKFNLQYFIFIVQAFQLILSILTIRSNLQVYLSILSHWLQVSKKQKSYLSVISSIISLFYKGYSQIVKKDSV